MSGSNTAAPDDYSSALTSLLGQVTTTPPPVMPDTTPVKRGFLSLLGEALGGGTQIPMSDTDKEGAGLKALHDFSTGLMAASHYQPGQTLFSNLASGFQGAEQSITGSEQLSAGTLAARQAYQQQQQEQQLARVKEAVPLLTALQTQQRLAAISKLPNPLTGGTAAPGTSIATGGSVGPAVARDPNVPTIGQQGNNPGNISAGVPGSTGYITAGDGQKVATFPDAATGVAAHADQLGNYAGQGIKTVQDAVNKWVGKPGADNTAYINSVSKALGVAPGDPINLSDPTVQRAFILAQQPQESGKSWLSPADVDKGLALAQARRQGGSVAPQAAAAPGTQPPLAPVQVAGPAAPTGTPPAPGAIQPVPNTPAPTATPPGPDGSQPSAPPQQPFATQAA